MWSIHLFVLSAHTELPKQCFLIKLVVNGIISKAFLFRKKIGIFFFFFTLSATSLVATMGGGE